MLQESLLEIVKGIGRLFLNPLFYWIILLYIAMSYKRIKKERTQFGTKILPFLMEGKYTLLLSLVGSLIISLLAVSLGVVITYEMTLILLTVVIILSLTASAAFLSASYTIGITFIVVFLLNFMDILPGQAYNVEPAYYLGLSFLAGVFLVLEGFLLLSKKAPSYPELTKSGRGVWIGEHHLKRLAFIPFFCLFPASAFAIDLPLLPYINLGGETYMLVLFPFVIGYDYKVLTELPQLASRKIGKMVLILGLVVLGFAVTSMFLPIFSIAAILIAIIGKEWLMYTQKKRNKYTQSIFQPLDKGIKVLTTIPDSPAARLGIKIGETIVKVNGEIINDREAFYGALQNSGAFCKLEIKDTFGEVRFLNTALYDRDHHELGVVFVERPFRENTE